ncbi:MAG: hypothetical protein ACLPID_10215 [Beijerinckiaceae bacterium]
MDALTKYLKLVVEPTVEEFQRNPFSLRHCYLACVATYHSIDRAAEIVKKRPATLRQVWGRQSIEFKLVDIVAHDFKHIHASDRNVPPNTIPLSFALYGRMGFNTHGFNDSGQIESLRNLTFVVRDALKFVHAQAKHLTKPYR